jgi:cytoskeletal protein RodZ
MDIGSELRHARESRGIALRDIAARTKIAVRVLEALERNDLSRLPGGIFTRAIIRSYAAEVGLDPDQAMRNFLAQFPHESGSYSIEAAESAFKGRRQLAVATAAILGVAIAIVAGLLIWNARRTSAGADQQAQRPQADTSATASTGTQPPSPEAAGGTGAPAPAPSPAPQPVSAPPNPDALALVIQPKAPCWVSLTVDGERVFSKVIEAGQRESATARTEILADVGDGAAFGFTINGLPGREIGAAGEVVKLRITKDNYRTFLRQ